GLRARKNALRRNLVLLQNRLVLLSRSGLLVLGLLARRERQVKHENQDPRHNAVHGSILRFGKRDTTGKCVDFTYVATSLSRACASSQAQHLGGNFVAVATFAHARQSAPRGWPGRIPNSVQLGRPN